MRIRIRFRKCALRVDAWKTGFKAHSIRFEVASGQASGLQRNHLQFGSSWPEASDWLRVTVRYNSVLWSDWTRPNPGAGTETVYQCYQTLSASLDIKWRMGLGTRLIWEWGVSASSVHYSMCSCCHSWHEFTHLRVGCICLECALYVLVVNLGMSGPIWEWDVSASSVHYMFLLSLLAWVDPSESGVYLPRVCIMCSCCHSWHEWTHLRVECICLKCALYVLVVNLGMSGPISEWDVSASSVCYVFLSLLAWVDPSESGVYLPRVCIMCSCCQSWHEWTHLRVGCICLECVICSCCQSRHEWTHLRGGCICLECVICSCCQSRHEWTHLRVGCICLECVLCVIVVNLGMSGPIWEWGVSALSVRYMFLLSLSAWVDPPESGMYLPRVCVICSCCHSAWVDPSESGVYLPLLCVMCSCCDSRHEGTHLRMYCVCLPESVSS